MSRPFEITTQDRKLAVLIDPDKHTKTELLDFIPHALELKPDAFLLGGSLVVKHEMDDVARLLRSLVDQPVVLFPGHFSQLTDEVDAVLLLSLISGRNPDLLIGQHVLAAPKLAKMRAEVISTGYMLIDGGAGTSVSYISHSLPIPRDKTDIAVCTALAGKMIGMRYLYLDAGSGAKNPVPIKLVKAVADACELPLIVGGGIRNRETVEAFWQSGANLVVVGNAIEENSFDLNEKASQPQSHSAPSVH